MADMAYDYRWKVLLLGDSGGGKTNIISQFTEGKFDANSKPTMGMKPIYKMVQCNSKTIKTAIWDAASREHYRCSIMNTPYYTDCAAAMIVYDITSRLSYENASRWLDEVRDHVDDDTVIMLVGNKTDLNHKRVVKTEEAKRFADEKGLLYIETSALSKDQVDAVFGTILDGVYKQQCKS
ncbi:hypothetical protein FHETE_8758 [Fusarium heterosporum]|uniref:Uncharacterized protein n=1 Tax=Fusarium heterosporum TaxID=42747 RepID=A0A8H5T235_FUSHE|nr:hypothetical protein FHETE_8758 [Fusarium heterosporum]